MHRLKDHMRKQHPEIKLDNYGSSNNITSNGNSNSNLIVTTAGGAKKNEELRYLNSDCHLPKPR